MTTRPTGRAADAQPDSAAGAGEASASADASPADSGTESGADSRAGAAWRVDRVRRWRWLLVPISIYAATRAVQLLLINWMAPDGTVRDRLLSWDAGWFVRVARDGYPHGYTFDGAGEITSSELAFFPGYPWMIRLFHGAFRLDHATAAILAAWIAAGVLAVLVYRLAAAMWDTRVATVLTVLVCTQPMSVVLSMGYSEPLFLALVTGALLAAYRHRWLVAGGLGLAAGLTRPTGVALAAALMLAALLHVAEPGFGRRRWWALPAAGLSLLGVPAYLAWVGWRVGEPDAWFKIQTAGWGTEFDFGASAARFVFDALRVGEGWVHVSVALLLIAAVVTTVLALRARVWPPLIGYGLVALILVVGQAGYYHSKPRLLVPVLLTLVPAALALGRVRPRTAAAVLVGFALFGLWYGSYLITVWQYAI